MLLLVTIDLANAAIDLFDAYEAAVLPLVAAHGGTVETRMRAVDGSGETHLLSFPGGRAFDAFLRDPERERHRPLWERSGVQAVVTIVERLA